MLKRYYKKKKKKNDPRYLEGVYCRKTFEFSLLISQSDSKMTCLPFYKENTVLKSFLIQ